MTSKPFSLKYGDGSTVAGVVYNDTVSIAGLQSKQQAVGAADVYSPGFAYKRFPADGLLGMAFQSISSYNRMPVFQSLVAQGQLTRPLFGFKLADQGSELYIGGVNSAMYSGEFTYVKVTTVV
jgi:cathepsin D